MPKASVRRPGPRQRSRSGTARRPLERATLMAARPWSGLCRPQEHGRGGTFGARTPRWRTSACHRRSRRKAVPGAEHYAGPRRRPPKGVAAGVLLPQVRLHFDQPGSSTIGTDQQFADQGPGRIAGIAGEEVAAETPARTGARRPTSRQRGARQGGRGHSHRHRQGLFGWGQGGRGAGRRAAGGGWRCVLRSRGRRGRRRGGRRRRGRAPGRARPGRPPPGGPRPEVARGRLPLVQAEPYRVRA